MTGLWIGCPKNRSSISDREKVFFTCPKRPEQLWGPHRPPLNGYMALSPGVNRAGPEVEHSHLVSRLRVHEVGTFITDDEKNSLSVSLCLKETYKVDSIQNSNVCCYKVSSETFRSSARCYTTRDIL